MEAAGNHRGSVDRQRRHRIGRPLTLRLMIWLFLVTAPMWRAASGSNAKNESEHPLCIASHEQHKSAGLTLYRCLDEGLAARTGWEMAQFKKRMTTEGADGAVADRDRELELAGLSRSKQPSGGWVVITSSHPSSAAATDAIPPPRAPRAWGHADECQ